MTIYMTKQGLPTQLVDNIGPILFWHQIWWPQILCSFLHNIIRPETNLSNWIIPQNLQPPRIKKISKPKKRNFPNSKIAYRFIIPKKGKHKALYSLTDKFSPSQKRTRKREKKFPRQLRVIDLIFLGVLTSAFAGVGVGNSILVDSHLGGFLDPIQVTATTIGRLNSLLQTVQLI